MEYSRVAVQVQCPQGRSICQIADEYLTSLVKCGKCGQVFSMRVPAPSTASRPKPGEGDEVLPDWDRLGDTPPPPAEATKSPLAARLTDPELQAPLVRLDMGAATSVGKVRELN